MADIALISVAAGFFGLCLTYVRWLDRMIRAADDSPASVTVPTRPADADEPPKDAG